MGIPECNTLPAQQSAAEFPAGKGGPPSAFGGGRVARHIYLVDKIYPHALFLIKVLKDYGAR